MGDSVFFGSEYYMFRTHLVYLFSVTNIYRQASDLCKKFKEYLRTLNFFPSVPPSTDEHELRTQRISTRLFIFIFSIAFVILLLYNSLITVRKTVNVDSPSLKKYLHLYSTYSQTLTCPCSIISINYNKFLVVKYTLHQVCNSIFVDRRWINYLVSLLKPHFIGTNFRHISSYSFQALRTFCDLVNRTISDGLIRLYSKSYVSASVISENILQSDTNASIDNFRSLMTYNFLSSRLMIREITQANALFSGVKTNYDLKYDIITNTTFPGIYYHGTSCSCYSTPTCISQAYIDRNDYSPRQFNVTGFYMGCYVIESLLQSTLECFYNQECIDKLQYYLTSSKPMNVTALDVSLSHGYLPNSTIQQLIDNLMIVEWNVSTLYEQYYNECEPIRCTYVYETRNDVIYIVTTLFGIVGGLTTVLSLIVPRLIRLVMKKKEQQQQQVTEETTLRDTIRQLLSKSKHYLTTFNLFPSVPPSTDEHQLRSQRISTRLFIVLFILSMTILLLYTSLIRVTKMINVDAPSFRQYSDLNLSYSETLRCPCSVIAINYNKFLIVNYTLHQVCSSVFINQSWINYLGTILTMSTYVNDFRKTSGWTFQALRTLCELLNRTIYDSLTRFHSNQYVSATIISKKQYDLETKILTDEFRSSMKNSFSLSLSMIRNTTQANGLFSILQTNYRVSLTKNNDILAVDITYGRCSCASSSTCTQASIIFEKINVSETIFEVPGFYVGCHVIESLLQSTLECFYNQECIDKVQGYFKSSKPMNITALDTSLSSEYRPNSTIQQLIDNLMIEEWNVSTLYERYYNECQPIQCTYVYETRNDVIYIVTTLFGIAGGLTTVLKLILPRLINLIMKKKEQQQQQGATGTDNERRIILLWQKYKSYFINLNYFPSVPPSTDENELRIQRISTKLFIFLFILSMAILLLYTSLIRVTRTINVDTPSFEKYSHLNSTYSQTLTCPCSVIAINHKKFLTINYTLHQICSSVFVNQSWIDYRALPYESLLSTRDFRRTSQFAFQALNVFCGLINRTINDSLTMLYANQYVSATVIPQKQFYLESEILIKQFRSSLKNSFSLSLSMIENTTQGNALFSALRTNYKPHIVNRTAYSTFIVQTYNNCSCASSSTCTEQSAIYQGITESILFEVPGFYTGCYVIESLFQSTLECFYDQVCIDQIQKYMRQPLSPMNVTALNASLPSEYHPNSTIQKLIDNLMIEKWNWSTIYEQYYDECEPIRCTYTFETSNDVIYIVTTLFGMAGGLVTFLQFVVPRFVNFIMYCIRKQSPRIVPEMEAVQA